MTAHKQRIKSQLTRALRHLTYSADKTRALGTDPSVLTEADLEAWESNLSRFARVKDLSVPQLQAAAAWHPFDTSRDLASALVPPIR